MSKNEVAVQHEKKSELQLMTEALVEMSKDKDVSPEKINSFLDAQERVIKFQQIERYNAAWARLMVKLQPLKFYKNKKVQYDKDKNNKAAGKETAFKFCPLGDIDKVVRPILQEEGFFINYTTEPRAGDGGGIVMTATILHEGGHSVQTKLPMPLDSSGGKTNAQAMGSSVSYAWRHCLRMLLNIIPIDEDGDDDGQGGPPNKIDVAQVEALKKLIGEAKANEADFLKFMGVEKLEDIWVVNYQQATVSLQAKKARMSEKK